MAANKYEEITIRTEPVFQGKVISLQVDHVRLPDGTTATREVVKHPGAAAVLAMHNGRMVVVEQYRKALGKSQVEIPAGKLDAGEDPMVAAARELEEETGYRCASVQPIGAFYTSPGFADELLYLYAADELEPGTKRLDDDEFLDCTEIDYETAVRYIQEGRISDAKTIAAVYAWRLHQLTGSYTL